MSNLDILKHRFLTYQETFKGSSHFTITWFRKNLELYFRQACITSYEQITRKSVEAWIINGKVKRQWSPKTILNKIQVVSSFSKWLIKEGYFANDPTALIDRPKQRRRIPESLSKEDALTFLEWTDHYPYHFPGEGERASAIVATFIYTGIRRSELMNLKLNHVDFDRGTIFIQSGKGNKDRIVPINSKLEGRLRRYLAVRKSQKRKCPYFFTSTIRDRGIGVKVIAMLFEKLRKSCGIYCYPHLLRHTFATLMLEGGCDLYTLSKLMGHTDSRTTAIYLSVSDKYIKGQIEHYPI